jgi:hypothetical protein
VLDGGPPPHCLWPQVRLCLDLLFWCRSMRTTCRLSFQVHINILWASFCSLQKNLERAFQTVAQSLPRSPIAHVIVLSQVEKPATAGGGWGQQLIASHTRSASWHDYCRFWVSGIIRGGDFGRRHLLLWNISLTLLLLLRINTGYEHWI